MAKHALFIKHKTRPGKRDEVEQVWRRHMMPAISANPDHEVYVYSFGADPDTICAFQQYGSADAAAAFLKHPSYAAYLDEVTPLLTGEPEVQLLSVRWSKGA